MFLLQEELAIADLLDPMDPKERWETQEGQAPLDCKALEVCRAAQALRGNLEALASEACPAPMAKTENKDPKASKAFRDRPEFQESAALR